MPAGENKAAKESESLGKIGVNLTVCVHTMKGTLNCLAARATEWHPAKLTTPPLASTVCAPMNTLDTLGMTENTALCGIKVVEIPL